MDFVLTDRLILIGLSLFTLITVAAYTVYAERKVCALIQQRIGPNRVGPFGLLQPLADVVKLLLKEDIVPTYANKTLHFIAPVISVSLALSGLAVLPFARGVYIADVNIGILYVLAVGSIAIYGVTLSGWSSNSKYALLGGLRSSAQMISYELSLGLSVISVVLLTNEFAPEGSEFLKISSIVEAQTGMWNVFRNPIGFFIFATCAFAEANRAPFDLAEAEQELVGGFHTEYSSMKFANFFLAEYIHVIMGSAMITTLFFGGYLLPFESQLESMGLMQGLLGTLLQLSSFLIKTFFFMFVFIWVRWTLPRFKYNQLMDIGWKWFLPIAIINIMLVAAVLALWEA
jgi:NADH-quinone oxidoreductase subunit H